MLWRLWMAAGAAAGFAAVALSALAAHAWPGRLPPAALASLDWAIRMLFLHALALVLAGWLAREARVFHWSAGLWVAGLVLFCGSVFATELAGLRVPLAPAGGTLLMAGWLALLAGAFLARG